MSALGIDGCKAGWCYYLVDDESHSFGVVNLLEQLIDTMQKADHIFIDMPIGLLDSGEQERQCDRLARKLLSGRRKSSVFRVPVREAVYASSYETASKINLQRTGKKLSKQSWFISRKMSELDTLLRAHDDLVPRVYEAHPELCFEGLAGHALEYRKATGEGFQERLDLLLDLQAEIEPVVNAAINDHGRRILNPDDILDACMLALSASNQDICKALPEQVVRDSYHLPMQIHYLARKP